MVRLRTTPEAAQFLHEGYLALSEVESQGVRIDTEYLERKYKEVGERIRAHEDELRKDAIYKTWRRRFGEKANIGSHDQLGTIIFDELGHKRSDRKTDGDKESADEEAFKNVNIPFVKAWFAANKLRKIQGTYLTGIRREMVQHSDGLWYVHPIYNGNRVASHRSSCNDPNFQNNPVRNPEAGEIVRRCYVPRPGHQLLELDYGQIEVRIPCCYHADPVLMDYVFNPSKDMHRDTAMQLFFLNEKQGKQKDIRHIAKNQLVFPEFYGSYYGQCAPRIWEEIQDSVIEGTGVRLIDHLAAKGIDSLGACDGNDPVKGTFEYHVKKIEEDLWESRFKVYAQWKRDWYHQYLERGGFMMLTGFAITIPLDRKQVCNYPIQGVAFHCCLWSLTRLVAFLRRYKMRSRVIGEVHDCINLDVHPAERDDVINVAVRIMTEDIKRWAPWLNVPLVTEPEACPIDGSWHEKMALANSGGKWVPEKLDKWESKYGSWDKQLVS